MCSDGVDRNRQEWLTNGCDLASLSAGQHCNLGEGGHGVARAGSLPPGVRIDQGQQRGQEGGQQSEEQKKGEHLGPKFMLEA